MAQKLTNNKKEILQDLDGDNLPLPPYWMMTCPPLNAPPGPEATLTPNPRPDCRASISAGSDPSNEDLWSAPPGFHLSRTS
ncbi:hypothetical protein Celaphus_00004091 [Cervus elaphus hippelaphus]|uniref:Uncharacterized protein n=1 Tax=Cervus elaphus hippelaphus TaxID=46360 RepID=A0A212DDJ6_CEREH|nr:hypothetical protein Celaphus_00004091 [Cervus elaphus hippelaphus]